ncbi:hypothetical protein Dimus_036435 [Dionaea muscipula]
MAKILHSPHLHTTTYRFPFSAALLFSNTNTSFSFSPPPYSHFTAFFSDSPSSLSTSPNPLLHSLSLPLRCRRHRHRRSLSTVRALENSTSPESQISQQKSKIESEDSPNGTPIRGIEDYPTGEFEFEEFDWWKKFLVKIRMLFAFPWERVKKGSVLTLKLRGQVSDQLKTRFSSDLSLPQICENFVKAAYDPRISGIYLHIESLNFGWGKVEEIRRHILDFRKSGKFIIGYVPACGEKEYYLACACEEIYAPPSAYFRLYGLTVEASFLGGTSFFLSFM